MPAKTSDRPAQDGPLTSIGYGIALLLLLLPLLGPLLMVWPWRPSNVQWRVGAFGIVTEALVLPICGLALAAVTAGGRRERRVLLPLSAFCTLLAGGLAAGLGLFALDVLEVRQLFPAETVAAFQRTAMKAAVTTSALVAVLGWLGRSTWRAGRGMQARVRPSRGEPMILRSPAQDPPPEHVMADLQS